MFTYYQQNRNNNSSNGDWRERGEKMEVCEGLKVDTKGNLQLTTP